MAKLNRQHLRVVILVLVATFIAASLTGLAWWRWKVDSALEAAIRHGPSFNTYTFHRSWYSNTASIRRLDDFVYLARDYPRVMPRLMVIAESDPSTERRVNAVRTIQRLSAQRGPSDVYQEYLPKLLNLAFRNDTPPQLEAELAKILEDWIPSTGLSDADRRQVRDRASRASNFGQDHWIGVLGSISGRQEVELLIQLAGTNQASREAVITHGDLSNTTWSGLLPHVQKWLADPNVSSLVTDFVVLARFSEGRQSLRSAILDEQQPTSTRRAAFNSLAQTQIGQVLLDEIVREDAIAKQIDTMMDFNCRQHLAAKREEAQERNGKRLWMELIDGLSIDERIPNPVGGGLDSGRDEYQKIREESARATVTALRRLSGRADLTTKVEWQTWLQKNASLRVEQSELLEMIENRPELIASPAILRRIVLWDIGYMPENCEPIYRRWLNSSNPEVQHLACDALLNFGQSPEAVNVAIDLIESSPPVSAYWDSWAVIYLLKNCFAVNFFWDTDAWRDWAKQRRAEAAERKAQE